VKRSLLFWAFNAAAFLCIATQTGFGQGNLRSTAALNHPPAAVLAFRDFSVQNYAMDGASSTHGNHFGVDFTFNGADGSAPTAPLIEDAAGNLYGTTSAGGYGFGVVFKLDSAHHETVLHAFTGPDGATPYGALLLDGFGNIYGTTSAGGDGGLGTVFRIDPQGIETVLHSFTGTPDGAYPSAGLVSDNSGNLYGTTENGGAFGYGTLFKIEAGGVETVLHSFAGGPTDGANPKARLILDLGGNLYSTTFAGGSAGYGTVFTLDTTNTETVLYNFTGGADGGNPYGGVTRDSDGVLYGTTVRLADVLRQDFFSP
jgi:uncharacterized repeat protein (TIGR03803 family)